MPAVAPSPALALLTGQNFLKRVANDAIYQINGFSKLSVAVTADPHAVYTAGQNGVVISKHRADNDQRQWRVVYTASTGIATVELYDGPGAGALLCVRAASVAFTTRSVLAFVYDGAVPSLNVYVNGALANGALTGTVPTVLVTNTEPLAVGAEATSGAPINVWRGSVHMVAVWNLALSGAEVATVLSDGVVPAALQAGAKAPQIICEHGSLAQDAARLISQWTDSAGNSRHLTGGATTGAFPFAQQAVGGLLVLGNRWDDSLIDIGHLGLGQGLSSTYTSGPPFRLWGAPLAPPTRAAWRNGKHDFTVLLRARRIAGTTETLFFQAYGVELRYQLSSQEMFAIVGVDTSVTNQNKKISFGVGLIPVEGLTADLVLRYNAASDDVDLFVGASAYAKTQTASNSFYNGTTLTLSDEADFSQAIIVPAALSDAQISQLQVSIQQSVYSPQLAVGVFGWLPVPHYTLAVSAAGAVIDDGISDASLSVLTAAIWSPRMTGLPTPGLTPDPYAISEVPTNLFDNPLPEVVSIAVNGSYIITATGLAGSTNAYFTAHWWEVELEIGGTILAATAPTVGIFFFAARVQDIRNFSVPAGQNWNGKRIRLVVQAVTDSAQIWRSAWTTMAGAGYNRSTLAIPVYSDPAPVLASAAATTAFLVTLTGQLGLVTSDLLAAPSIVYWWEFELTVGVFYALARETTINTVPSRVTIVDTFTIPAGFNLNGRNLRLAARNPYNYAQVWRSAPLLLADENFDRGGFKVPPLPPGPAAPPQQPIIVDTPGVGVRHRPNFDFSNRSAR